MNWGRIKAIIEGKGIKDEDEIDCIDIYFAPPSVTDGHEVDGEIVLARGEDGRFSVINY